MGRGSNYFVYQLDHAYSFGRYVVIGLSLSIVFAVRDVDGVIFTIIHAILTYIGIGEGP